MVNINYRYITIAILAAFLGGYLIIVVASQEEIVDRYVYVNEAHLNNLKKQRGFLEMGMDNNE